MKYTIEGVEVTIKNGTIPEEEATAYVDRGREMYGKGLTAIIATLYPDEPDMIGLEYKWCNHPFNRLRRITGYLVGSLSRWNNAKSAEEKDRVKHGTEKV